MNGAPEPSCPDASSSSSVPPAYWQALDTSSAPRYPIAAASDTAEPEKASLASYETTEDGIISEDPLLRDHTQLMLFFVTHNTPPKVQVRISGCTQKEASKKHPKYDFEFGLDVSRLVFPAGSIQTDPEGANDMSLENVLKAYGNSGATVANVILRKRIMWKQERLQALIDEHLHKDIRYKHSVKVTLKYGNPEGDGHEYVEARTCRGWAAWSITSALSSSMARKNPPALQSCFPMMVPEDVFVEFCKMIISRGARTKLKAIKPIRDLPKEMFLS